MDLQRLDGTGYLEHDPVQGKIEDKILRETIDQSRLRMKEFEERQLRVKQEPIGENDLNHGQFIGSDYHSIMNFQNWPNWSVEIWRFIDIRWYYDVSGSNSHMV